MAPLKFFEPLSTRYNEISVPQGSIAGFRSQGEAGSALGSPVESGRGALCPIP